MCALYRETKAPLLRKATDRVAAMEIPYSGVVYVGSDDGTFHNSNTTAKLFAISKGDTNNTDPAEVFFTTVTDALFRYNQTLGAPVAVGISARAIAAF